MSVAGLTALNALFLVAGCALLFGLRGLATWGELVRLAGLGYLLGVAAVTVVVVELVIVGAGAGVAVVAPVALGLAATGGFAGRLRGRRLPALALPQPRREPFLPVGLVTAALSLVLLEAAVRAARLQGLFEYDAWAFWTAKAKMIYGLGGLDRDLIASIPGPPYPLLIPTLQAIDFHFMGRADTTTLHVQYAFLLAGFVFAVLSLLRPRVPLALAWPFLALMLVMPDFDFRMLNPQADLPLDYFFVCAALCVGLWLMRRDGWLLAVSGVFLAAVLNSKREGQMLTAILVAAALVATLRAWRWAWPRLLASAAGAYLFALPWRIWLDSHRIGGEWEEASWSGMLHHLGRIPPALRVVAELLFDWNLWLLAVPLAVAAALLLLVRRREPLVILYLAVLALGFAGMTWIYWAFTRLPIDKSDQTPVPRVIGALILLSIAFAPLMLSRALHSETPRDEPR